MARSQRLKPRAIPAGWSALSTAMKWRSHDWLMRAKKNNTVKWDVVLTCGKRGRTIRKLIFLTKEVRPPAEKTYRYPGLVTATETGLRRSMLHYLQKTGQLWSAMKLAVQPKTGRVSMQRHFREVEIERLKNRPYTPGGKPIDPNEADRRMSILDAWEHARRAGVKTKDFCAASRGDREVKINDIRAWQKWRLTHHKIAE